MMKNREIHTSTPIFEKEHDPVKRIIGETLTRCYYDWKAYDDVFLSFPEQNYFNKKILRLGMEILSEEDRRMCESNSYIARNKDEMGYVEDMMNMYKQDQLTPFQLSLYLENKKYLTLSLEKRRALEDRIKREGVARLPKAEKELYQKYVINKYRRQWFTSFLPYITMAVSYGYLEARRGKRLIKAAEEIRNRVVRQSLNTSHDIEQGDALIIITLRNIFPQLRTMDVSQYKEALETIFEMEKKDHLPTPS